MEPKRVNKDLQDATLKKWVPGGPRGRPGAENYSKLKQKWNQNGDKIEAKSGKKYRKPIHKFIELFAVALCCSLLFAVARCCSLLLAVACCSSLFASKTYTIKPVSGGGPIGPELSVQR